MSRKGKKRRLSKAGMKWDLTANRHEQTFWSDGDVLKLDFGDGCIILLQLKNYFVVYLKWTVLWYLSYASRKWEEKRRRQVQIMTTGGGTCVQ